MNNVKRSTPIKRVSTRKGRVTWNVLNYFSLFPFKQIVIVRKIFRRNLNEAIALTEIDSFRFPRKISLKRVTGTLKNQKKKPKTGVKIKDWLLTCIPWKIKTVTHRLGFWTFLILSVVLKVSLNQYLITLLPSKGSTLIKKFYFWFSFILASERFSIDCYCI